jgi:hypothetical protein
MCRNYLKGRDGDRINAVLAAAGYNFSLLLRWLEAFACLSSVHCSPPCGCPQPTKNAPPWFFTDE